MQFRTPLSEEFHLFLAPFRDLELFPAPDLADFFAPAEEAGLLDPAGLFLPDEAVTALAAFLLLLDVLKGVPVSVARAWTALGKPRFDLSRDMPGPRWHDWKMACST
jgi:hypothetical protein